VIVPLIVMFVAGAVIGVVLIGIASWRTRVVPVWAAVVIIIAGPINFLGQGHAAQIISNAVLLVGLGTLGVTALRMSDEQWNSPRERTAVAGGQVQAATA
jgi:hypothetical protein